MLVDATISPLKSLEQTTGSLDFENSFASISIPNIDLTWVPDSAEATFIDDSIEKPETPCAPDTHGEQDTSCSPDTLCDPDASCAPVQTEVTSDASDLDEDGPGEDCCLDTKFVMTEVSQIRLLLKRCHKCGKENEVQQKKKGALLSFYCRCPEGHRFTWRTSQCVERKPIVNTEMSAAIFCSGITLASFQRFVSSIGLAFFSDTTYYTHIDSYVSPVLQSEWFELRNKLLSKHKESDEQIKICGDGKFDSPWQKQRQKLHLLPHGHRWIYSRFLCVPERPRSRRTGIKSI
jgi:hypothetical protein